MRTSATLLLLALLASTGCGSGERELVSPTATVQPSARQIVERSVDAMNRLLSARVTTEVRLAGDPDLSQGWKEFREYVSPDRADIFVTSLAGEFQRQTIEVGSGAWMRTERDGAWTSYPTATTPFVWPQFRRLEPRLGLDNEALPVAEPRVLREDAVDGRPVWVVSSSYQEPSIEGPFNIFITEWIEKETYLLLRHEHYDDDPFGAEARVTDVYSDFNEPIVVEPPA